MDSVQGTRAFPRVGFPIRKSPDQSSFSSSPRLIAAVHVLHRLLVPRHPPCALVLLSFAFIFLREHQLPLCSFQGTRDPLAPDGDTSGPTRGKRGGRRRSVHVRAGAGLSKLNSMGAS